MLGEKSGLQIEWIYREWFTKGKRPKLKVIEGIAVQAKPTDLDTFEDETGEFERGRGSAARAYSAPEGRIGCVGE